MAKIVFLSLVFPPDSVSTAQIMGNLAEDLLQKGHTVQVLTTTPHYNRDLEAESIQPRMKYWGKLLQRSSYKGITVYHVLMPQKGSSIPARLLAWSGFHALSTISGLFAISKPDVYIVPSPPLTIGLSAWILKLILGVPFIYNVQEIYPDYAISLGAIRNKWLIRLLYKLESFVYREAKAITVIAPHMGQKISEKGVPANKIKVIPNFVDVDELQPLTKDNNFSRKHNIHDKFVISYAGNMGPAQGLETFIDTAILLQEHTNVHFMMMGDGMLRKSLERRIEELRLPNFSFLPYQPYSLIPQIYAASDICLVPQEAKIASVAVPSKIYRIMSCARPVIAITNTGSDLADLVIKSGCGMIIPPDSPEQLANTILSSIKDISQLQIMGLAGRKHVVQYYSRQAISQQYHNLVDSLIDAKESKR
jgi:colanic acid biosynthesis glycosyl transferase WcaI